MNNESLLNKIKVLEDEMNYETQLYNLEVEDSGEYETIEDFFSFNRDKCVINDVGKQYKFINYMFENPYDFVNLVRYNGEYLLYINMSDEVFKGSLEKLNDYCKAVLISVTLGNLDIPVNDDTYSQIEKIVDEKFDVESYDSSDLQDEMYDLYYGGINND